MAARSETRILFVLTLVVGCLSGLAAVAFHRSIDLIEAHTLAPLLHYPPLQRFALTGALLVITGNGLKDIAAARRAVGEPLRIKADVAELDRVSW